MAKVGFPGETLNLLRIVRYGLTGLATFAVFAGVNALLVHMHSPPPLATAIAFLIAGIVNFLGHHRFTFASSRPLLASLPRYCLLIGFNAVLGAAIVALLTGPFAVSLVAANAVSLVVVTALAYVLMFKLVM